MTRGGKRVNAGNKEGNIRPKFNSYWSIDDIEKYMIWLKKNYKKDPQLVKWVGDHIFGKPVQPLVGGDEDDKPIKVDIGPVLAKFYGQVT